MGWECVLPSGAVSVISFIGDFLCKTETAGGEDGRRVFRRLREKRL